jgi:hypothetical protein
MSLGLLVVAFVVIIAFYYGVIRGWLFKGILLVFGSLCIGVVLSSVPECRATAFTIGTTNVSLAAAIPLALVVLVLLTTKE